MTEIKSIAQRPNPQTIGDLPSRSDVRAIKGDLEARLRLINDHKALNGLISKPERGDIQHRLEEALAAVDEILKGIGE